MPVRLMAVPRADEPWSAPMQDARLMPGVLFPWWPARAAALRLRVAAAFFAEAERSAAVRLAAAWPPRRPPLREGSWFSG